MQSSDTKYLICVLGPTASGKTGIAVTLAKALHCEVLSCDSRQFYREMQIGTARPSAEELNGIPHHFLGHLSVEQEYTASQFEKDALAKLTALFETNNIAILCGGSGLFADAVCKGFDEGLPEASPKLREELNQEFQANGIQALQDRLAKLDPECMELIDTNNPVRLIRAIEVCELTNKKFSSLRTGKGKTRPFKIIKIAPNWERDELFTRINNRVDQMKEDGLIEEVQGLIPKRNLNALKAVGYRELFEYFDGTISEEQAVENIKTNTRKFAKRQETWFRKDEAIRWLNQDDQRNVVSVVNSMLHD